MKFFINLNKISAIYALALSVAIELIINVTHISEVTGWEWDTAYIVVAAINVVGLLLATLLFIYLTKKWLIGRKMNYWSLFLWFPYFLLFFLLSNYLVPFRSGGIFPRYSLLIDGSVLLFPVYILFINMFATPIKEADEDHMQE